MVSSYQLSEKGLLLFFGVVERIGLGNSGGLQRIVNIYFLL